LLDEKNLFALQACSTNQNGLSGAFRSDAGLAARRPRGVENFFGRKFLSPLSEGGERRVMARFEARREAHLLAALSLRSGQRFGARPPAFGFEPPPLTALPFHRQPCATRHSRGPGSPVIRGGCFFPSSPFDLSPIQFQFLKTLNGRSWLVRGRIRTQLTPFERGSRGL